MSRNVLSFILKSRQIIDLGFLLIFWTKGLSSFTRLGGAITYTILRDQHLTLWTENVHQNYVSFFQTLASPSATLLHLCFSSSVRVVNISKDVTLGYFLFL